MLELVGERTAGALLSSQPEWPVRVRVRVRVRARVRLRLRLRLRLGVRVRVRVRVRARVIESEARLGGLCLPPPPGQG